MMFEAGVEILIFLLLLSSFHTLLGVFWTGRRSCQYSRNACREYCLFPIQCLFCIFCLIFNIDFIFYFGEQNVKFFDNF